MQDVKFRKAGREMKKEADNNKSKIFRLITALVQCGLLGFGGGNALIPVLYRKAVEEYHLISKDDFEEAVVVASITPGALPVEIAAGIGRITGGDLGMLCAAAAISLPGCLLVLFFTALLSSFGSQLALQINYLSVGVTAYILYVLGCYVAQTLENSRADRIQSHWEKGKPSGRVSFSPSCVLIITAVFLVTCGDQIYHIFGFQGDPLLGISTVNVMAVAFFLIFWLREDYRLSKVIPAVLVAFFYCLCVGGMDLFSDTALELLLALLMLVMALWGLVADLKQNHMRLNTSILPALRECAVAFVFMAIFALPALFTYEETPAYLFRGALSSILSFGGGDAYLAVAGGMFVTSGLILYSDFYSNLVPVANAVPGSILCKILTGTGYFLGYRSDGNIVTGLLTGLCGFGCAVAMSCITYSVGAYFYEQLENAAIFSQLKKSTRPIISGLLFTVGLGLIYNCIQIGTGAGIPSWFPALLCLFCLAGEILFVKKFRYRPLLMVLISAGISLLFCNLASL